MKATRKLILTKQSRLCSVCREPTAWATDTQLRNGKYGLCMDHSWCIPVDGHVPTHRDALRNLGAVGRHDNITDESQPDYPWRVRCHWIKSDVVWTFAATLSDRATGPCTGCRRPTRRYGAGGNPLCGDCRTRRTNTLEGS